MRLQDAVSAFINYGGKKTWQELLNYVRRGRREVSAAAHIVAQYETFANAPSPEDRTALQVQVGQYEFNNPFVQRMMEWLEELRGGLLGAYVHGSMGTNEVIPYSDFDALVVIEDRVMRDRDELQCVAIHLRRALRIMYEADPLQHHGWFVLTEADLKFYNEAHFPHELFRFSKSMMHGKGLQITIYPRDSSGEVREAFLRLANALQENIRAGRWLENIYHLKNTLSLFMLIPSLYVQVRDGRGIFKRDSFGAARVDFAPSQWRSIERVSEIRKAWDHSPSPFRRKLLSHPWAFRRLIISLAAPSVPSRIALLLSSELFLEMDALVVAMKGKLGLGATDERLS